MEQGNKAMIEEVQKGLKQKNAYGSVEPYNPLRLSPDIRKVWIVEHPNEAGDLIQGHWVFMVVQPGRWGSPSVPAHLTMGQSIPPLTPSPNLDRPPLLYSTARTGRLPACSRIVSKPQDVRTWGPGMIVRRGLLKAGHARTYLYYARILDCPIYVVHATTKETLAEIEKAKGAVAYSEIGTHYLVLHKDAWKINVPLRDRSTHETLWRALASGAIDCIGSDHVAHTRTREAMETGNVWTTVSGFPSRVEGMFSMMLSEGVNKGRISIARLAQVASENPARIFGLYPKKGAIVPGADADLVVVDLERKVKITRDILHTVTPWTIYDGWEATGWPVMTMVRGHIVMEWPEGGPRARISDGWPGEYQRRRLVRSA
jgi:hypothetical protein